MDLWFEPTTPWPEPIPACVRLLLRMVGRACQVTFGAIPRSERLREVQRGQLERHRRRLLSAEEQRRPVPPLFPVWIVTPGKPAACFRRRRVRRTAGWPPGIYWTDEDTNLWFVVVRELPVTRETLVLRLLGSAAQRREALEQIREMPAADPEKLALLTLVERLAAAIEHDTCVAPARAAFVTTIRAAQLGRTEVLLQRGLELALEQGLFRGMEMCKELGQRLGLKAARLDYEMDQRLATVYALHSIYEHRLGPVSAVIDQALCSIVDLRRLNYLFSVFESIDAVD